jgi:glycosyltransferase involved in cell wall biosynthesis
MGLSAVIITYNEEKNIERCLRSLLPVADEIIVVDSFSTDRTREICESFKVAFSTHKFEGHIQQKNYAMRLAAHDYVLSLDADEALSPELSQSILEAKKEFKAGAYEFNRLTSYCGQWIHHCGWYPDRKIRLWNKSKGQWAGVNPHDKVVLHDSSAPVKLSGDLHHHSYHSLSDHLKQLDKFTTIAAEEAFHKKKTSSQLRVILYPLFTFIKMYFLKLGFLDGYAGFLVCVSGAYYRFMKYAKLRELIVGNRVNA